jgi:ankyrin repeat protein
MSRSEAVNRLLLDAGKYGQTPLLWAVISGHPAVVKLLIDTRKVIVNMKDSMHGQTPLFWAAMLGHEAVVKLLLDTDKVGIL